MWPDLLAFCSMEILANPHFPVILQYWLSDVLEHLKPVPHRLWLIVIPLNQWLTGLIINAINFRWIEHKVVNTPTKIIVKTIN